MNRAPLFAHDKPPLSCRINEGDLLRMAVEATDPDDDSCSVRIASSSLPRGTLVAPASNEVSWQSRMGDAGTYQIRIVAYDGADSTSATVAVTIGDVNAPPRIIVAGVTEYATLVLNEGDSLLLTVAVDDIDSTDAVSILSPIAVPWVSCGEGEFATQGDSARLVYKPGFDCAGTYSGISIIALDNGTPPARDTFTFAIRVKDVNRPPRIDPFTTPSFFEGHQGTMTISARDPDGTIPALSVVGLPTGAQFSPSTPSSSVQATLSWTPGFDQSGSHPLIIRATDGAYVTDTVCTLMVINTNRPPVFAPVQPPAAREGAALQFQIVASDPDNTVPTLVATSLPANAGFTTSAESTYVVGTFTWTPGYTDAGVQHIEFTAGDGDTVATHAVNLVVANTNRAPRFQGAPSEDTAHVGNNYSRAVSVRDDDGVRPEVVLTKSPAGMQLLYDKTSGDVNLVWHVDRAVFRAETEVAVVLRATDDQDTTFATWPLKIKGHVWRLVADNITDDIFCAADSMKVFSCRQDEGQIRKSLDGGRTWQPFAQYDNDGVRSVGTLTATTARVYAASFGYMAYDVTTGAVVDSFSEYMDIVRVSAVPPNRVAIADDEMTGYDGLFVYYGHSAILRETMTAFGEGAMVALVPDNSTVFLVSRSLTGSRFSRTNLPSGSFTEWHHYEYAHKYDVIVADRNDGDTVYVLSSTEGHLAMNPSALTAGDLTHLAVAESVEARSIGLLDGKTGWVLGKAGGVYYSNDAFRSLAEECFPPSEAIDELFLSADAEAAFALSRKSGGTRKLYSY